MSECETKLTTYTVGVSQNCQKSKVRVLTCQFWCIEYRAKGGVFFVRFCSLRRFAFTVFLCMCATKIERLMGA